MKRNAVGGPVKMRRRGHETAAAFSRRITSAILADKAIVSVWFNTGSLCRRCATDYVTDGFEVELHYADTGCYNCPVVVEK